jgi:hypothetical protein
MKLKLMILGYARHGKDTVAEILTKNHGLTFANSSYEAGRKVMMPYFESIGIFYKDFKECYADRVNHRAEWFEQISAYNTPDRARLAREIYAESDVYVGIRSRAEFDAIKKEGLFQYAIWVDRSKHVAPEPASSNNIDISAADYVIDNNGTLEQLTVRVSNLYWDLVSLEYGGGYERGD